MIDPKAALMLLIAVLVLVLARERPDLIPAATLALAALAVLVMIIRLWIPERGGAPATLSWNAESPVRWALRAADRPPLVGMVIRPKL